MARTPIDQFILARLDREGLQPSPEADKATLIRRVTFDLTGLPPTPDEIDAFLADRSPDAYEKLVDALLHSPHYGERMAMPWLDPARYADTNGYHIDSLSRDVAVARLGDRRLQPQPAVRSVHDRADRRRPVPNATREQKIASGFNRNHMINFEGGAIAEEYLVEYVVDRVEATSSAFLGLTIGCARCHSHKYDPITHKEFYQFFAFFNSVPEQGLDGRLGNAAPVLLLPSTSSRPGSTSSTRPSTPEPMHSRRHRRTAAARVGEGAVAAGSARTRPGADGLIAHYEIDGSFSDVSGRFQHGRTVTGDPTFDAGPIGRASRSTATPRSASATSARSIATHRSRWRSG